MVDRLIDGHVPQGDEATDALAEQRLVGGTVRAALERLSAGQREAIVLACGGGHTQAEIAKRTKTPLGTVKTRTATGMRLLAAELRVS